MPPLAAMMGRLVAMVNLAWGRPTAARFRVRLLGRALLRWSFCRFAEIFAKKKVTFGQERVKKVEKISLLAHTDAEVSQLQVR